MPYLDEFEGKGIFYYNDGTREMGDYLNGNRIGKHVKMFENGEVEIRSSYNPNFLLYKGRYYIVHVGDSRIYQITGKNIYLLTNDQTFIAREIAAGRMTVEQSKTDPRRSVLLQCVGASEIVEPEFSTGVIMPNTVYMVCSDGFRHQISEEEMIAKIGPENTPDEQSMKNGCIFLTELVKQRRETDNITVGLIKTV